MPADPTADPTPPDGDVPAVTIDGIYKRFGDNVAVDTLTLTVPTGCFFGMLGPNGAGKTTTLRMAAGLLRPDSGRVTVAGIDVWAAPAAAKRAMGVLPDDLRLFERLTGTQMLTYAGLLRSIPDDELAYRRDQLLDLVGLHRDRDTLVTDYSTGMRKKLGLACALIHRPDVLFLDEPFEAVDPVSATALRTVLTMYCDGGGTVVFSSHVLEIVERICHRIAIVADGRVVADGTVAEITAGRTLEAAFADAVGAPTPTPPDIAWLSPRSLD